MTRQRIDNHSTEFGIWIRQQPDIDSHKGYRNYNLDIIWWKKEGWNKTPKEWMLIEEKRYLYPCKGDQLVTFQWLHEKLKSLNDPTYKGFYILQFENTNPDDGKIFLDEKEISKEQLMKFLKFEEHGETTD